jgi:hypothetical protein
LPVLAVVVIVGYADVRVAMGLPGHRGLIWLTLLVTVALATHRRATVLAVGTGATVATFALQLPTAGAGSARYLAAAILLYAVMGAAVVRRREWLVVLAAAPIHLVALADSVTALLGRGYPSVLLTAGMAEKLLFHLGFGLAAGALGWAIASTLTGAARTR